MALLFYCFLSEERVPYLNHTLTPHCSKWSSGGLYMFSSILPRPQSTSFIVILTYSFCNTRSHCRCSVFFVSLHFLSTYLFSVVLLIRPTSSWDFSVSIIIAGIFCFYVVSSFLSLAPIVIYNNFTAYEFVHLQNIIIPFLKKVNLPMRPLQNPSVPSADERTY